MSENQAHDMNGNALTSQIIVEGLGIDNALARTSQAMLEALGVDNASVLTTQVIMEALGIDNANAMSTQVLLEAIAPSMSSGPIPPTPQIIQSNETENLVTRDNLMVKFGTPEISCPKPPLCINPGAISVSNSVLPVFPLTGDTIAYNMNVAPVSLVVNLVSNTLFTAGLYAFYEKNGSVWYKFKTTTQNWSNEEFLVTCGEGIGIADSRTIFDCSGYPITAYRDSNGYVGVNYYLNGISVDRTSNYTGTSPNVIIYNDEILVVFVPTNYSDSLSFLSSGNCYSQVCSYPIDIPNSVISFTLRQTSNVDWIFSFVSQDSNQVESVYYAEAYGSNVTASSLFICPILPFLVNIQLMNQGQYSYADNLMGYDFVVYSGLNVQNDISGFSSRSLTMNDFNWTPGLNSYFTFAVRQDDTQDIKWPVLNVFNNKLGIAWLETSETGILRLNYVETLITKSPIYDFGSGQGQIFIYPYIGKTAIRTKKENIPFDNLKIVDFSNNVFKLDTYAAIYGLGYNLETPGPIQSVHFLQSFRQKSQELFIKLTTAPQETQVAGLIPEQPLVAYPIVIYDGDTNHVFTKLKTGLDGITNVTLPQGLYKFEVQTLSSSVLWQQTLL